MTVPGIDRGRRFRSAQGRALRCRARHRQPGDRADHRRRGRSARGPRRPARARHRSGGCGTRAIACGRIASRRSTASIFRATVLDIIAWGGDPRDVRVVRAAAGDEAIDAALRCSSGSGAVTGRRADRPRPAHAAAAASPAAGAHAPRRRRFARRWRGPARCLSERHFFAPRAVIASRPRICCRRSIDWQRAAARAAGRARDRELAARRRSAARSRRAVRGGVSPGRARRLSRSRRAAARAGSPRVRLATGAGAVSGPKAASATASFSSPSTSRRRLHAPRASR